MFVVSFAKKNKQNVAQNRETVAYFKNVQILDCVHFRKNIWSNSQNFPIYD